MATPKVPGWGALRPQETRAGPGNQREFLVCPDGHDAPFWAGLAEINRHGGRIIYGETSDTSSA